MTIEMIDKWVTSFRFKGKKQQRLIGVLIDFYFLWAGRDYSLGVSISHLTFPEVTSVWGVSAVAILDLTLILQQLRIISFLSSMNKWRDLIEYFAEQPRASRFLSDATNSKR